MTQSFQKNGSVPAVPAVNNSPGNNVVAIGNGNGNTKGQTTPNPKATTTAKHTGGQSTKTSPTTHQARKWTAPTPVICTDDMVLVAGKVKFDAFLADILRRATPHGNEQLIYDLISKEIAPYKFSKDEKGNLTVVVPTPNKDDGTAGDPADTLFVCHMDTVHHKPGMINLFIAVQDATKEKPGYVRAGVWSHSKKQYEPSVLGADDKLGVYILTRLIRSNIPGTYLFCVGEERGCIGSRWKVKNEPEFFKKFKKAVSFDRKGYGDVVYRQRGSETASREFALALSNELNELVKAEWDGKLPQTFKPDPTGIFTDSAVMDDLIPECINLSVGYFDQHCDSERFDYLWLLGTLVPILKKVDWAKLPITRSCEKPRFQGSQHSAGYHPPYTGAHAARLQPHLVDEYTPVGRLPVWKPIDGLWFDVDEKAMMRIMWGFYNQVFMPDMKDLYQYHMHTHRMEAMIMMMTHRIEALSKEKGLKDSEMFSFLENPRMQRVATVLAPHVGKLIEAVEAEVKSQDNKGTTKEPADKEGDSPKKTAAVTSPPGDQTTSTTKPSETATTEPGSQTGSVARTNTEKYGIQEKDAEEAGWPDPECFPDAYVPAEFNPEFYKDVTDAEWTLVFTEMQAAFEELTAAWEEHSAGYVIIDSKTASLLKPYIADWNFLCSVIIENGVEIGALEFASAAAIMTDFIHLLSDFVVHEAEVQAVVEACFRLIDEHPDFPIFDEFDCDTYRPAFNR